MEKRTIKYGLVTTSVLMAIMMVSSVSAIPYVQHKTMDDEIGAKIDKILESKSFQNLKSTVTPLFNESFNESTRSLIQNNFLSIITDKIPDIENSPYFPQFCEFLIVILEAMFLLLGHGIIGTVSALVVVYLITFVFSLGIGLATIPYCVVATIGITILGVASLVDAGGILYQFGVFGFIIAFTCLIPVAVVILIIGTPIMITLNIIRCFEDSIIYTTDIIFP